MGIALIIIFNYVLLFFLNIKVFIINIILYNDSNTLPLRLYFCVKYNINFAYFKKYLILMPIFSQ